MSSVAAMPAGRLGDRMLYRIDVELRGRSGSGHATVRIGRGELPGPGGRAQGHPVGWT